MRINGIELEGEQLQAHIVKFKYDGKPIHTKTNMPLWHDIYKTMKEVFTKNTKWHEAVFTALEVRKLMWHNVGGDHAIKDIEQMLKLNYEEGVFGGYVFLPSDFIKEATK